MYICTCIQTYIFKYSYYDEIFVQTSTSAKYGAVMRDLLKYGVNVHLAGPQGNGKSLIANNLFKGISTQQKPFLKQKVAFTSQTQLQGLYEVFMNREVFLKYKQKLVAPPNEQKILIFIDNLNMPMQDLFGTVPVLEFLRQILDRSLYLLKINN